MEFTKLQVLNLIQELSKSDVEGASLTEVAQRIDPTIHDYRLSDAFFNTILELEEQSLIETIDGDSSRLTEIGKRELE